MEKSGKEKIGKPYLKYQKILRKRSYLLRWIQSKINNSEKRTINVIVADIAKEMGHEFEKLRHGSIYLGLRYVLFYKGYVVKIRTHNGDDEKVFVIRERQEGDKLPQFYRELEKSVKERKVSRRKKVEDEFNDILQKEMGEIQAKRHELTIFEENLRKEREEIQAKRHELTIFEENLRKEREEIKKQRRELEEKGKFRKFYKYSSAIKPKLLPRIMKELVNKEFFEMNVNDVIEYMNFPKRMPQSMLEGLRYVLNEEGIDVSLRVKRHIGIFCFKKRN